MRVFHTPQRGVWLAAPAALLIAVCPCLAGPESRPKKVDAVTVQAFADRSAVAPGGVVNIAVRLSLESGWHVYWKSPGPGTGLPTQVTFKLPSGVQAGRTHFPVPQASYNKELDETAWLLEDSPVLITPIKVPQSFPSGGDLKINVETSWLACKTKCIPGMAEVTLTVPVTAKEGAAANEELFKKARTTLPVATDKAEHVRLSAKLSESTLKPNDKAFAILSAEIAPKHHMQSHKPHDEELIAAYVFVEPIAGIDVGDVEYPAGQDRDVADRKLSEYSGKVEIKIPLTVDKDPGNSPRYVRGVFKYQICTDAGVCYLPQQVEFVIPVQMQGGPAPTRADEEAPPAVSSNGPTAPALAVSGSASNSILTRIQDWLLSFGYFGALLVAFIGGLILNIMPCVLPVISLKILSFVRQSHEHRSRVFWLGMTYGAGILTFFGVLALLFTLGGQGWGQLFQNPRVVLALAGIVTAFSLSLFGVWAVFTPRVVNKLGEKAEGEGFLSAYFTGVLATFLGTACTAPFLSAALGAASRFNAVQGAGIFLAVGLGMAAPFILLAANPTWLKFVPRPGPWMATFEAGMGFFLLATVIWLLNPLRGQLGDYGLLLSLIFLLGVSMAAWIKGKIRHGDNAGRKAKLYMLATAVIIVAWLIPYRFMSTIDTLIADQLERNDFIERGHTNSGAKDLVDLPDWSADRIQWRRYHRDRALATVSAGYTVFIDYTADWCANCKTMLKTAIEQPDTIKAMKELNVVTYTADYTLPVPEIKEDLARFKRGGVPVFVVYRPGDTKNPDILPEIITTGSLVDALKKAGPSRPALAQSKSASGAPAASP